MRLPDIYFDPSWGELNNNFPESEYKIFEYSNNLGRGYYHFIKKRTPFDIDGIKYYDTVTPYGFNGPIILECEDNYREKFIKQFDDAFQEYCLEERIVAEYVRFSPWLMNHKDFQNIYNLKYNNYTLSIDLTKDFFTEEFSSKCRNHIRKAIKSNVEIEYDFDGNSIEEFYRLYKLMAKKNNIGEEYRFLKEYFIDTFNKCRNHVFIINAVYDNKVISSSVFLQYGDLMHYHFSANDMEYSKLNANSLILYTAATWGKENNKKTLHLGGAFTEELFRFKHEFTKNGIFDYYVGTKIRNQEIYDKLVEKKGYVNEDFFPAYR